MQAYIGPQTLSKVSLEWGVEAAASPGGEVDPGLLQFSHLNPGQALASSTATLRPDTGRIQYRRGVSSRIVYDDEFGDTIQDKKSQDPISRDEAHANFVRALVGSIYLHTGRQAARAFIKAHILSRHLQVSSLFSMRNPTRDLARLCAREDFEYPVARLLSETGRLSRTPVFVVGIFSGTEKLGEGAGPSLNEARTRAAVAALKSWYMYSPGSDVNLPSDMEGSAAVGKVWEPVHIDMGEIA